MKVMCYARTDGEGLKLLFPSLSVKAQIEKLVRGYPYEINKLNGKPKPYSMTKVSTVEMGYLIDEIQQLAAELGIVIEPRVSGEYAIFR